MSAAYRPGPEAVPNGIANDATNHRLFVTGTLWPRLFQIEVVLLKRRPATERLHPAAAGAMMSRRG